jgi:hypothetical protein
MGSSNGSVMWRGDAEYYRRRLRVAFTYQTILEMTAHSYVVALENNPFLDMRNHAIYLSTVFSTVSYDQARKDIAHKICEWLDEGLVEVPDEFQMLADEGQVTFPFDLSSRRVEQRSQLAR